ncbi:MAG: hypothetical protein SFY70_04665 [Bacteroidia bacterium]|nr:hypothetical protein [Bacteroidia bacterium]
MKRLSLVLIWMGLGAWAEAQVVQTGLLIEVPGEATSFSLPLAGFRPLSSLLPQATSLPQALEHPLYAIFRFQPKYTRKAILVGQWVLDEDAERLAALADSLAPGRVAYAPKGYVQLLALPTGAAKGVGKSAEATQVATEGLFDPFSLDEVTGDVPPAGPRFRSVTARYYGSGGYGAGGLAQYTQAPMTTSGYTTTIWAIALKKHTVVVVAQYASEEAIVALFEALQRELGTELAQP